MNPLVSVITRTKNRPLLLARAVESVKSQTYAAIEHVIVNDGGDPDAVTQVLSRAGQSSSIVIHNPESVGMEAASNLGIRRATGEYVVIHDDDDSWDPAFLSELMAFILAQPPALEIQGAVSLSNLVIEKLSDTAVDTISVSQYNSGGGLIQISRMAYVNQYPPISFIFSKHAWETLGGFNQHLPVLGDWDFYLRFLSKFNIAILPQYLANYHQRPSSDGIYGNTVIAQKPIHLMYDSFLRNQYARHPEIIGDLPSLLVNLAVGNDQKAEKKKKDMDLLAKLCMSLLQDRPESVYIFGASEYGIYCKDLLEEHVKVVGFLDNYHTGSDKVDGCPVFKPDVIRDKPNASILVSSIGHREVIIEQLKQLAGSEKWRLY